jgi:hypothetical protein
MTAPRPQLRLVVDAETGELVEQDERDVLIDQLQAEKKGQSLQIGKLKRELRELRAVEPQHEQIREVLVYCNEVWQRRLHIIPASEGWEKVRARLADKIEGREPWQVAELKLAADGALLDPWMSGRDRRSKGYLAPKHVYKSPDKVQEMIALALGFEGKAGVGLGDLLEVMDDLGHVNWRHLLRICECGHRRQEHAKGDPDHDGRERCFLCGCEDFFEDPFEWLGK